MTKPSGPKMYLVSLGCPKNLIDSEILLGTMLKEGYTLTGHPEEADLLVVNSCSFVREAKEEAVETILRLAALKRDAQRRHLVVVGCLPQRYGEQLLELIPEVDLFLGSGEIPRMAAHLRELTSGGHRACHLGRADYLLDDEEPGVRPLRGPTAYVRIAEGCSNRCSYCVVPLIRGPLRSRTVDSIVTEVRRLTDAGIQEIVLVAQDTTAFGVDRSGRSELPELLMALEQVQKLRWLRLMYVHPGGVDERFLEAISGSKRLCPYLDLPIQHISPGILKAMNRRVGPQEIRSRISAIRKSMPGVHLRTTVIVGFPGETEEEFQELLEFLKETRFEWLGAFIYSKEEGTDAARMKRQVTRTVAKRRLRELMRLQQGITSEALQRWVGREIEVLVEGSRSKYLLGRAAFQAPEVDGVVRIKSGKAPVGSFALVRVTVVKGYDLEGVLLSLN